ncbi:MAG: M23 family peptidase [Alphaproteobacteria bacterium]|nr:MAG: M23 family peptidase [Alphaproteobacteria bacterium]
MRHWVQIRDRILNRETWKLLARRLARLVRASESPAGFAGMAASALVLVLLLNMGGDEPPAPTDADISESYAGMPVEDAAPGENPAAHDIDIAEQVADAPAVPAGPEILKLKRGQTLSQLLDRAGLSARSANAAVHELAKVTNLRHLRAGQAIRLTRAADDSASIHRLSLRDAFDARAVVMAGSDGYTASREAIPTVALTRLVEGEISDNLYMSGKRAGLPDKVIVELIRLMSFDIDFERDIREGDRFQVYFERSYAPSLDETDEGRILQVKLELKRGGFEATWFEDEPGHGDYFDSDGKSARRALMKTPLDVAVITSSYGSRKHPVLGYTRMHKGVDFRAPTGTPIMAAGDGVVERASRYGSYGNYVRIRHNGSYSTAYAHLSKYAKGIRAGARVRQGQVIGYSGATGRVSAAHLHYEVLVDGKQANPMTLKLPSGKTLKGQVLTAFLNTREATVADIARIQWSERVMLANSLPEQAEQAESAAAESGLDAPKAESNLSVQP